MCLNQCFLWPIMFPASVFTYFERIVDLVLIELLQPSQSSSFIPHLKLLFVNLNLVLHHNIVLMPSTSRCQPLSYHNNLISVMMIALRPIFAKLSVGYQLEVEPLLTNLSTFYIT